jgi:hypothetical protein
MDRDMSITHILGSKRKKQKGCGELDGWKAAANDVGVNTPGAVRPMLVLIILPSGDQLPHIALQCQPNSAKWR